MRFDVKVMRDGGAVTRLALDASDSQDAARLAKAQGYAVSYTHLTLPTSDLV